MALAANLINLAITLPFFWVPADTHVRPMVWSGMIFIVGVGALVVLPLTLLNSKRLRGRTWPRFAVVLSLTPIPLALLVQAVAKSIVGFHESQ